MKGNQGVIRFAEFLSIINRDEHSAEFEITQHAILANVYCITNPVTSRAIQIHNTHDHVPHVDYTLAGVGHQEVPIFSVETIARRALAYLHSDEDQI